MAEHYYTERPTTEHKRAEFETVVRGVPFIFATDAGVFSKGGLDFGSRLLMESMRLPERAKVLDVGCGYGPIGIAAAKLYPQSQVTMIDVNERAVELARENAKRNEVANVEVLVSDLYEQVASRSFDVILTNPPIRAGKSVVHAIFTGAVDLLRQEGSMWIVIQKKQGAPSALAKLEELFERVKEENKKKGYRIFHAIKGFSRI